MDGGGGYSQARITMLLRCIAIFGLISNVVQGGRSVLQTDEDSQLIEELTDSIELQAEERKLPLVTYTLGPKITDWNEQRTKWIQENPEITFNRMGKPRMMLVTSSQSEPCPTREGDHYLMKFLKNKIDYARLHDIEIYYNMVVFDERVKKGFFIKLPLVRKLMLTHPEAEWIWWMDSDAVFTDMSFEIPLEKYKDHNMIVHGWPGEVYEDKNWVGLNAGIFLLRNCQWSLDLLDIWAAMGVDIGDNREQVSALLAKELRGMPQDFLADDQSALVYLLSTSHTEVLKPKVFLENSYDLHRYWVMTMELHEAKFKDFPWGTPSGHDWSFMTHFVGCKPCSLADATYSSDKCFETMERAYNLADNQIMGMSMETSLLPMSRKPDHSIEMAPRSLRH